MLTKAILARILHSIAPSSREMAEESRFARKIIRQFSKYAPRNAKVRLMGSVAKGTFLRDSRDLDVFILLPKSFPRSGFEAVVKSVASGAFPEARREIGYAEHPYVRVYLGGRKIDLVPAYGIHSAREKASSVDRSVLHVKYILGHLPKKSRAEVLLLKKFLKSNGLYGAEIRVEGLSGYLCELLVLKYKTFVGVLRAASRWKARAFPVFIDLEGHYAGRKAQALKKFFGAGLVVADPVDASRNVSAVVSEENIRRFASLSCRFLKKPSLKFFESSESGFLRGRLAAFLRKKGPAYALSFHAPRIVDDILWGQLKRFARNIETALEKSGFAVAGSLIDADEKECRILLRFKNELLPEKMEIKGPPLGMEKHVLAFLKSHKSSKFIKKSGHVFAVCKRRVRTPYDALAGALGTRQLFPSHVPFGRIKIKKKEK